MNEIDISRLDLNLLKALRYLLEERNVSRAAERMYVSQSAMSHTLKRLRENFNDPLLVRVSRHLEPTDKALSLYQPLCDILDSIGTLLQQPEFDPGDWQREITLHTHEFVIEHYLAARLRALHKLAPGLSFRINRLSENSYQRLENGELDFILAAGVGATSHSRQRVCYQDPIVCLMDRSHPLAEKITAQSLFDYSHVALSLLATGQDPISHYARQKRINRHIAIYSDDLGSIPALVNGTDFIACVPQSLAEKAAVIYGLVSRPVPISLADIEVKLLWHERHQNDERFSWLRGEF